MSALTEGDVAEAMLGLADVKRCSHCGTTATPQWRGSLCNSCGVYHKRHGSQVPDTRVVVFGPVSAATLARAQAALSLAYGAATLGDPSQVASFNWMFDDREFKGRPLPPATASFRLARLPKYLLPGHAPEMDLDAKLTELEREVQTMLAPLGLRMIDGQQGVYSEDGSLFYVGVMPETY
jgi:GATA zinc finger